MANSRFPILPRARSGISNLIKKKLAGLIPFLPGDQYIYRMQTQVVVIDGAAFLRTGKSGAFTDIALAAGTAQEIALHTLWPRLLFPANVTIMRGASVRVRVNTAGLTTCTIQLGDAGDPNGLVTASNLHTGTADRRIITPAAAEYEEHFEAAFEPTITLTSTVDDLDAATAGQFDVRIPFRVEDA